jgi:hypothetical protein
VLHIDAHGSSKGKYRTDAYSLGGERCFAVAEKVKGGVLISEFGMERGILGQAYVKSGDPLGELAGYLHAVGVVRGISGGYARVELRNGCQDCGSGVVVRELDVVDAEKADVPVVPIFTCTACKKRFYAITDEYLSRLVEGNLYLFAEDELEERGRDKDAFINTLNEYVIRVFASKKIGRLSEASIK